MFKSLTAWIVLQNKVFINQEQLVLAKEGVKSPCRHILLHSNTKKKKNKLCQNFIMCLFPNVYIWSYKRLHNKPVAHDFEKDCS